MGSESILVQHTLWTTERVILGALFDWAILMVDPQGIALPKHLVQSIKRHPAYTNQPFSSQSPEQEARWNQFISDFYNYLLDLASDANKPEFDNTIAESKIYLQHMPGYDQLVTKHLLPENRFIGIIRANNIEEDTQTNHLTEYMLHLEPQEAMRLLENLAVLSVLELPGYMTRGLALYYFAEGLEH